MLKRLMGFNLCWHVFGGTTLKTLKKLRMNILGLSCIENNVHTNKKYEKE